MIRSFLEKDIPYIYELGEKLSNNFSKTNNLKEILNNQYTKILVYEDNNIIKGFLMYTDLIETVDICDIIVKEEYRHQKIASCLLDYLFGNLNELAKLITLEVRKDNILAISLYKKFGFEIITTRKKYYKDIDGYLMGRSLK